MKKVLKNTFGPFCFFNNVDKLVKICEEMCNENPYIKRILECGKRKVNTAFGEVENNAGGEYKNNSILLSSLLDDKEEVKVTLMHEYTHFVQETNINNNFPYLNFFNIFTSDDFFGFGLFLLSEIDAFVKESIFFVNINKKNITYLFEAYLKNSFFKWNKLNSYVSDISFMNMGTYIFDKEDFVKELFIKIAECELNTFTSDEFGGEVFPKYNLDWNMIFEELNNIYKANLNFEIFAKFYNYKEEDLAGLLCKKFSGDDMQIKNYLEKQREFILGKKVIDYIKPYEHIN